MPTDVIVAFIGLIGIIIGAVPSWLLMWLERKKLKAEIRKLQVEAERLERKASESSDDLAKLAEFLYALLREGVVVFPSSPFPERPPVPLGRPSDDLAFERVVLAGEPESVYTGSDLVKKVEEAGVTPKSFEMIEEFAEFFKGPPGSEIAGRLYGILRRLQGFLQGRPGRAEERESIVEFLVPLCDGRERAREIVDWLLRKGYLVAQGGASRYALTSKALQMIAKEGR